MKQVDSKPVCNWHYSGVPGGYGPSSFFEARCWKCQDKRQRGVVSGNEPSPTELSAKGYRKSLNDTGRAAVARIRAVRSGRYCEYQSESVYREEG